MPTQAKGDFFIRSAPQFEAEGCCDASGVGDKTLNVDVTIVSRIWVCEAASEAKVISDVAISKHGICFTAQISILPEGLIWWNTKNVSSSDNVYCCDDWIECGVQ